MYIAWIRSRGQGGTRSRPCLRPVIQIPNMAGPLLHYTVCLLFACFLLAFCLLFVFLVCFLLAFCLL